ncbi:DUF2335 domain-containing protein [Xenorhabdus szentirmaii]|uniref:Uncharacterized protein n=1 Tax=Xenorhabdus szentirmaii DSM 16338 TaxID=1427518 RepID=W1J528_9GAMM|nr:MULTISPECIES: DUF2335 domain-containing protein [Xenorhabdus]MBD2782877.1 DUF2335 domain-containing protein [Xenorhabdus sp. 38]MBD2806652.1 DUF2335 domain-containing protein [Xenorhabdus sp. ZM]MBD2819525.1 DUF2335 domain-containing protein [Xenorhabdus sp. 42]MBD2826901.1 DUF2335 domain-containing protein [Xenorhabdus sp. 5]PHM31853.1 hypothetical protein Xsze_02573 [Xenorhabdus szentirmaii DSM 16338]
MNSNMRHYFKVIGSILDIMPANDYRDFLDTAPFSDDLPKNQMSPDSFPSPEALKSYEAILPGCAERMFSFREKEQAFRHEKQNKALEGVIKRDKRGQWMGFSIAMCILVIATGFALKGSILFAGTLVTIDLVGLVAVFVIGRKNSLRKS